MVGRVGAPLEYRLDIPRALDDKEVDSSETPLAQRDRSPRYMTAEEYYRLKTRSIYRSYPAYAAGREPAGYPRVVETARTRNYFRPIQTAHQGGLDSGRQNRL